MFSNANKKRTVVVWEGKKGEGGGGKTPTPNQSIGKHLRWGVPGEGDGCSWRDRGKRGGGESQAVIETGEIWRGNGGKEIYFRRVREER